MINTIIYEDGNWPYIYKVYQQLPEKLEPSIPEYI